MMSGQRDPSGGIARGLLLAALHPDGRALADRAETDWASLPWEWLLDRARAHKVLALFLARMDRIGHSGVVPRRVREKLEEARLEVRSRTARAISTLRQIAEVYSKLAIPFLVLKGSVLAEIVYGDPALRMFSDVDLLVPEKQMAEAEEALIRQGYSFYQDERFFLRESKRSRELCGPRESPRPGIAWREWLRKHHRHFTFVLQEDDPRLPIELHWHLSTPGVLKVDPDALWEQTTQVTLSGVPVRTLNLEATLLHVAVHAMEEPPLEFKLLHLCDVAWTVRSMGSQVRASRLRDLAKAWGIERDLTCALQAAESFFPSSVSEGETFREYRSRWSRICFRLAGMDARLVDQAFSPSRLGRLSQRLFREIFWDLGFLRPPIAASRTLSAALGTFSSPLQTSTLLRLGGNRR